MARHQHWLARRAFLQLQDVRLAGDPVARAALLQRYEPILQLRKDDPDVGEREDYYPQVQAGRIN